MMKCDRCGTRQDPLNELSFCEAVKPLQVRHFWVETPNWVEPSFAGGHDPVSPRHYSRHAIEPWDYVAANGLGYFEGSAIKYLSRWRDKNGIEDLRKAIAFIEKLIAVEEAKSAPSSSSPPR